MASVSPLRVYVVLGLMWHRDDGHGFSDILANVCQNSSQSIFSCTGSLCFEKEVQQAARDRKLEPEVTAGRRRMCPLDGLLWWWQQLLTV